ncbi:hypothetical protein SAMN06265360_10946 [Haloechinothrix alba]|uniref:Uncharacterized protein n=1 Tax=Haloechinothrix alba TaxID=664784 RepID=A0A238X4V5_9PSEU|nr:hypothetical protein SAMN06265360_10946 [Haloechinothrix alba]
MHADSQEDAELFAGDLVGSAGGQEQVQADWRGYLSRSRMFRHAMTTRVSVARMAARLASSRASGPQSGTSI